MKIQKGAVVSVRVEIVDEAGNGAPVQDLDYLHGGYGHLFPKVEAALAGLEPGASTSVKLAPAEGFGEHDPALIMRERRERLPPEVELGSVLRVHAGNNGGAPPAPPAPADPGTPATPRGDHPPRGP